MTKGCCSLLVLALFVLFPPAASCATYAVTIGAGVDLSASGLIVDGNNTNACVNITGTGSVIGNATLANCKDDAINAAESVSISNTATWCESDADCTNTIASGKTVTESHNAHRVQFVGDGTVNGEENNLTLTACSYVNCYDDLRPKVGGVLINAGTGTFTDSIGRTGDDIGFWQHPYVPVLIDGMPLRLRIP